MARRQVVPLSVDTSTPATRPPPASVAVPVMVTGVPTGRVAPAAGEPIAVVGGVVSVEAVAAVSPLRSVSGCTPMSANRFTVACWAAVSGAADPRSWFPSRAQAHWIVPALKTSAPLAARYVVIAWVACPCA